MPNDNESLISLVSFSYSEPIEFLHVLGLIANERQMRMIADEFRVEIDAELESKIEQMKHSLSRYTLQELDYFFGFDYFHKGPVFAFYWHIYRDPLIQTVEAWLDELEQLPAHKLVSAMVKGVYYDKWDDYLGGERWENMQNDLNRMLERVEVTVPSLDVEKASVSLKDCLRHPEETKQRVLFLLRQFYASAFEPIRDWVRAKCEQGLQRYEPLFRFDPSRFFRDFFKNGAVAFSKPTRVHISYFLYAGSMEMSFDHDTESISLGIVSDKLYGPAAEREKVERLCKALGDKRRLDIIELLSERSYYNQELAQSLSLTPAAINYHMNFLFTLDLVWMRRIDHRVYYELDKEKMRAMVDLTKKVLLGE